MLDYRYSLFCLMITKTSEREKDFVHTKTACQKNKKKIKRKCLDFTVSISHSSVTARATAIIAIARNSLYVLKNFISPLYNAIKEKRFLILIPHHPPSANKQT